MELYIGKQHGEIGLEEADALMAKYPKYNEPLCLRVWTFGNKENIRGVI